MDTWPQWAAKTSREGGAGELDVLELLRDDVLSAWGQDGHRLAMEEEPRAHRASELIFAVVALLYPAWHWVFLATTPGALDPLSERLAISVVMIAAIVCFRFRALRPYMHGAEQVLLFAVTAHYLSLVWRNDLAPGYVVGTYVVFASVSVVITRVRVAVAYALFCLLGVGLMGIFGENRGALMWEYLLGIGTVLAAIAAGTYKTFAVRSAAVTRLSQGRQLMKQIIETIPDPVFVRANDRSLLLANEAGRQFENATGYNLDAVDDQEQRSLASGGTLQQDTDVSTAFGTLAMSVKTAVARLPGSAEFLVTIMRDVTPRRQLEESLRKKVRELEEAREKVRQLQGMLPICMHCSRIRVGGKGDEQWERLEAYVSANSNASFTHTLCTACLEKHFPSEESA